MINQDLRTIDAMETYGGSFVKALAVAARRADPENLIRIKATWPEYWKQYADMAGVTIEKNDDPWEQNPPLETIEKGN